GGLGACPEWAGPCGQGHEGVTPVHHPGGWLVRKTPRSCEGGTQHLEGHRGGTRQITRPPPTACPIATSLARPAPHAPGVRDSDRRREWPSPRPSPAGSTSCP